MQDVATSTMQTVPVLMDAAKTATSDSVNYLSAAFGLVGVLVGALIGLAGIFIQVRTVRNQHRRDELRTLYARIIESAEELSDARDDVHLAEVNREQLDREKPESPGDESSEVDRLAYEIYTKTRLRYINEEITGRQRAIAGLRDATRLAAEVTMSGTEEAIDFANALFQVSDRDLPEALQAFSIVGRRDTSTSSKERRRCDKQLKVAKKYRWYLNVDRTGVVVVPPR